MRTIDVGLGAITHLAFNPAGTLLAASGREGVGMAVWPALAEGRGPFDLVRLEERIAQIAWHPEGHLLATAGMDSGVVQLRDPRLRLRRELIELAGQGGPTVAIAFSPDGDRLAFGSGFWDEPSRAVVVPTAGWRGAEMTVGTHLRPIGALLFTDPDILLTGSADRTVAVRGLNDPADDGPPLVVPSPVQALARRRDGSRLAVAAGKLVHLWRMVDGRPESEGDLSCRGHRGVTRAVAFSPDGRSLASVGEDGSLRFWDAETGAARNSLDMGLGVLKTVAYHPDGLTLVAAGDAGTVAIVDAD